MSNRTSSSASIGHSDTSVGTVETTLTSFATSHGPRSMPAPDQRARRRHQARAVRPGQPDLLARGVEGDGQSRHHPVARSERLVLEEEPCLGVDERGGGPVRDGHALRFPGGARGEDDPRALATYVTIDAIRALAGYGEAEHSPIGIGLAAASLAIMPVLSYAQRRAGRELGSLSAVADSKQTLLCTYLSAVLLVGTGGRRDRGRRAAAQQRPGVDARPAEPSGDLIQVGAGPRFRPDWDRWRARPPRCEDVQQDDGGAEGAGLGLNHRQLGLARRRQAHGDEDALTRHRVERFERFAPLAVGPSCIGCRFSPRFAGEAGVAHRVGRPVAGAAPPSQRYAARAGRGIGRRAQNPGLRSVLLPRPPASGSLTRGAPAGPSAALPGLESAAAVLRLRRHGSATGRRSRQGERGRTGELTQGFEFRAPARIIFGPDSARTAGQVARDLGRAAPLVLTDPGLHRLGTTERSSGRSPTPGCG